MILPAQEGPGTTKAPSGRAGGRLGVAQEGVVGKLRNQIRNQTMHVLGSSARLIPAVYPSLPTFTNIPKIDLSMIRQVLLDLVFGMRYTV